MQELLHIVLAFPTVVFTVALSLSLFYWLFVVVGAVDIDALGGSADGALEGATKGVMEGAAKGVFEGAAKGVFEGATKGVFEGATKGVLEGTTKGAAEGLVDGVDAGDGVLASLLSALRLRSAPVTVVLSLIAVFGWLASTMFVQHLGQPGALGSTGVLFGSGLLALLVTSVVIRPLAPVFAHKHARTSGQVVGKIAVVATGEVTPTFGQATVEDGGAGLIVQIRAEAGALSRGDRVVLVYFDEEQRVFHAEKLPDGDAPSSPRARIAAGAAGGDAPDDDGPDEGAEAPRRRA